MAGKCKIKMDFQNSVETERKKLTMRERFRNASALSSVGIDSSRQFSIPETGRICGGGYDFFFLPKVENVRPVSI